MQDTLNIGASRPAGEVQAPELKPTRGRAVEPRGDRGGPAVVNDVRGRTPGVRQLARSVAAITNEARASQRVDKALASAQRRVTQLQELTVARRDGAVPQDGQIEFAGQFAAAEQELATLSVSISPLAGELLPPLDLGNEKNVAAAISQLSAAADRIAAERRAVETSQEDAKRAANSLGVEAGLIDEVSAREIVDITTRQIKLNQEAALNSHASNIVQAAIRAFS